MLKILITDDHAVVRKGLKQILTDGPDPVEVEEACDGGEAIAKVCTEDFDLVLMDISMPGRGGLDALKEIKSRKPKLPVLVFSMYPEEEYAVRALRVGASGYLTKNSAPRVLAAAIQTVLNGEKYVSPFLAEHLASSLGVEGKKPLHSQLTDREFQIMNKIASGKSLKTIAQEMSLSVKTISTYHVRILKKMGMAHNAELTHYVIKNNIVE